MENENINAAPKTVYYDAYAEKKPRIPLREAVSAWVIYALSFIFTHFCMPYFGGIWGGIFWAAFGIFIAVYAKINSVKLKKSHIVMLGISEFFCLTPLFSANKFVCFLAAFFSFALYFYLMTAVTGADAFGKHFILDFCCSILIRPFESFVRQPISAFSVFKGKKRTKNILYALAGLAISIPLTVVVVLLLISSDKTFGNIITSIFDIAWFSINWVWQLLFAVPIAMFLFGAAHSMTKTAPVNSEKAPEYRFIPPVIAYFTVSPICVFYLIYVIVQVGNIANAFGKNIGYADFARQGFFQLCAISVINLIVIIALQTFCKRKENDVKPLALRLYTIMISVFTLLIIATALTKMFMYINEYGMTMLRVYTSWFMILLAVIFIPIIVLQIHDYPIWKTIFAAFTVMLAVLCFGNFEGNIAAYNISAYRNGVIEKLDVDQFEELGIAAVPSAYGLYKELGSDRSMLCYDLQSFIEEEMEKDSGISKSARYAYFSIPRAGAWGAFSEFNERENAPEGTQKLMRLIINVDCSSAYSVEFEYLLNGEKRGVKGMRNANGTRINRGEELIFTFTEDDFPNCDELPGTLGVWFCVTGKNGEPVRPGYPEGWRNSSESYDGAKYRFSEGELEDGTTAEPVWEWNAERGGTYEFRLTDGRNRGEFYLFPMH